MDTSHNWEAYARQALPSFGLSESTSLRLLNISENATFKVDSPEETSVLRVHRTNYHSREAIQSELAWIAALRADNVVMTPAPIRTKSGEQVAIGRLSPGDERYVCRFAWSEGQEPPEEHLAENFEQLGAIAARLHQHAKAWRPPRSFSRFTWDFETSLGPSGHWGRWQDALGLDSAMEQVLTRCAGKIEERLRIYGKSSDRFGLVHADMRLANLLVDDGEVTVIDFDDCGFSWFMYDLASSLSFIEHEPYVPTLIDSWVRGYRSESELTSADERELRTFIMFRRLLLLAWIGSHVSTETAQAMGPKYTEDSCLLADEYLTFRFTNH